MPCLPRSSDVEQVSFGDEGVASGLSRESRVIDQTSSVADESR